MKRVVRTIDLSKTSSNLIPKSADTFYTKEIDKNAIEVAIPVGKFVDVTIQSGIVLQCKILSHRHINNEPIYEVVQVGNNLKLAEQQKLGVPVDNITVMQPFIAFVNQIQLHTNS